MAFSRAAARTSPSVVPNTFERNNVLAGLQSARVMAKAWAATIEERKRQQAAWAFIKLVIDEYVLELGRTSSSDIFITPPAIAITYELDAAAIELARTIGQESARLPQDFACHQIGTTYTLLVASATRSKLGMYYTPPALSGRLLAMAEEAGVSWKTASVLDPACGAGAFLLAVALRMREALRERPVAEQLASITARIKGFEIDPFAAWLAQSWLEIALADLVSSSRSRLPQLVLVCDALEQPVADASFDLVIGNPPYGRVSLTPGQRARFSRSLFGHANLYGVFTDVALRWSKLGGVIAYVTPTSFLAGEYFKALRSLLALEAPPIAVDFIDARRGVFEDVLQEALLATYRRGGRTVSAPVHCVGIDSGSNAHLVRTGCLALPNSPALPWLAPRSAAHRILVERLARMPDRLSDWGYAISTGPLVWNRHKEQLRPRSGKGAFPLVWAESITQNHFTHRAEKTNHEPFFKIEGQSDAWLKVDVPCVLVQRTTAKEQSRRIIAAELPAEFIQRHGAVVVENHLNMVRPRNGKRPDVSVSVLSILLNSVIVDEAFRCISGSVAVSAFELEALPLPSVPQMREIETLVELGAPSDTIEAYLRGFYLGSSAA